MRYVVDLLLDLKVKICVDQPIEASPDEAQAAFIDASFYRSLADLGGIQAPQVRSIDVSEGHARAVVGYRFAGDLAGPAARILDPAKLTWAQVSEVDLTHRRTQVQMVADHYAGLLSFSGWYELRGTDEGTCCQHLEADLQVHIPLLGPLAERALVASVVDNIKHTAQLLERYVASNRRPGQPGPPC